MSNSLDIKTFPLKGSRLIEASAGTGKTYTIALLYVRLVLGHGDDNAFSRPLTPPEILVVTFTDAASQELNDRIRSRLSEAAAVFAGDSEVSKGDPLADILADYKTPEQKMMCALKLQRAAEWMDEAAISTIHSWCYRMLREHAFESHNLFTQERLTDESELLMEVVQDYWRQNFYPVSDKESIAAIQSAFSAPNDLAQRVKKLITKPILSPVYAGKIVEAPTTLDHCLAEASELAKQLQEYQAEINKLETKARECWKNNRADIESIIKSVKLNGTKYTKGSSVEILLEKLRIWSEDGKRPTPDRLPLLATGRFALNGGGQPTAHPVFDDIKALVEYEENHKPAVSAIPLQINIALHAAEKITEKLTEQKMSRAELGYNDMLIRLKQVLTGKASDRLASVIRQQYPVAMIDEFQDTDPVQYDIFNRIYSVEKNEADTALVMIGDPKQAIYSFRGADIYTYIQARHATTGRHYTLTKNHRSTQALVRTMNHVFIHAEAHERGAFRFQDGNDNPVPFQPVEFKGRSEVLKMDGQQVDALTCWYLNGMNEHGVTGAKDYITTMAETSAGEIARWLNLANVGKAGFHSENKEGKNVFRRLLAKDIAILVRAGKEAAALRIALSECGVKSVYLSDKESVFDSQEAQDMHRWLQAVAEPSNDRLIKTALATRSLGITHEKLKNIVEDERQWEETLLRFRNYKFVWQQQGVLPMLRKLINDYQVTTDLHAKIDGERMMTNVLHVAEWLQQSSKSVEGEQALIRFLHEKIQNSTDEEDVIRLESDADLVKIVTLHKSKGLEYPLVLLPFICTRYTLDGKAKVIDYHEYDVDRNSYEVKTELAGNSTIAAQSYSEANDEGLSESMRLLYVALTRAQHSVWLGVTPIASAANSKENYLDQSGLGYLLAGGKPIASRDLRKQLNALALKTDGNMVVVDMPNANEGGHCVQARDETQKLHVLKINEARKIDDRWWVASYSALKTGEMSARGASTKEPEDSSQDQRNEAEDESSQGGDQKPTFAQAKTMHGFPQGSTPGTFLHSLLEWAAEEGFEVAEKDNDKRREFIARCCQRRGWEMWIDMLSAWVKAILNTELFGGDAAIRLVNVECCLSELEFYFESHLVNTIKLDRLVRAQTLGGVNRPELLNNVLNGMLKGFIDLVFEYNDKYYVADWKSNRLGVDESAYTHEAMCKEVLHHRYELQYTLYVLALHRHLQDRLPEYDYDNHIGGAVYVFLRGIDNQHTHGVHFEKPARRLIEELDRLFSGAKSQEVLL